jgi:hypothetical protein
MRRGGVMATAVLFALSIAVKATAAERYAVVITGASAGKNYAEKYDRWRTSLVSILQQKFKFTDDRLFVFAETEGRNVSKATRENVRAVLAGLRLKLTHDDLLFIVLIGHGTAADEDAKFNLVGPDLTASEWAALLKPIPGRLVFVDTTGGSFPFLQRLTAAGHIVLTATDTAAQQFETVFPEFFIKALEDQSADLDKNGRVSVWEAFSYASAGVRRWYDQQGQLPTERALLDDNGDGVGREAQNPGPDGTVARTVYFAPEPSVGADDELSKRRAELERQLDGLRTQKAASTDPSRYDAEIEKILLEIARISRERRKE